MSAHPETRRFRRIPISYQVKLVAEDRIIAFPTAIDLSMGGILVGGRERLPLGSPCGVAILLQDGEAKRRIVARGTVVRSDARGMAITFSKALDPGSETSLRTLIESLSPHASEPTGPSGEPADGALSNDPA
ncbi:MAG TPA: PilZ domain-containing protein [Geothrix sp.]|jgi:hypothetical protein